MPYVHHDEEMDQVWTNNREIQRHSHRKTTINWGRYSPRRKSSSHHLLTLAALSKTYIDNQYRSSEHQIKEDSSEFWKLRVSACSFWQKPRAKIKSTVSAAGSLDVSALLSSAVHRWDGDSLLQRTNLCPNLCEGRSYWDSRAAHGGVCPLLFLPSSHPYSPAWCWALTLTLLRVSHSTSLTQKKTIQCFVLGWVSKLNQLSAGWKTQCQGELSPASCCQATGLTQAFSTYSTWKAQKTLTTAIRWIKCWFVLTTH